MSLVKRLREMGETHGGDLYFDAANEIARLESFIVAHDVVRLREERDDLRSELDAQRADAAVGRWVRENEPKFNFGVGSSEARAWVGDYRRAALAAGGDA